MLTRLLVTAFAALIISGPARGESASELVGTWTLVSSIMEKDGKKTDQFGPGAHGTMSLDANGRFMLTIIGADLPKFAANNRAAGSPEDNRAVVARSIAMLGTYSAKPGREDPHLQRGDRDLPQLGRDPAEALHRHLDR